MNRIMRGIVVMAAVMTFTSGTVAAQSPTKIGYVAVQVVLSQTPGYARADSIWRQEEDGFRQQMLRLQGRMDSAQAAYDQAAVMMSAANRATERKKLEDLAMSLRESEVELNQRAVARQRELLRPIEERVVAVIEGIRAEGNYAVIFDVSQQGVGIVAADSSLDLTNQIIQRIRAAEAPGDD